MAKIKPRIPEGGAIEDSDQLTMEQYSEIMRKKLGGDYRRVVKYIINEIKPKHGSRVLEIGPGPGWLGIWLACDRKDIFLDGLEASNDMIRVAIKNAKNEGVINRINYITGVVENMNTISGQNYDLVISRESLHHWENPQKAFEEICRVLKPDGKIYIQDSRRDIGFIAKLIVNMIGPIIAGKMSKYWKSSIAASYTPDEVKEFINKIPTNDKWIIKSNILELSIESKSL